MELEQDWVYSKIVQDHFMNPRNVWEKESDFKPNGIGEVGSMTCGDQMKIGIIVENDKIKDIRWQTYGCATAIASTSMMSEMVKKISLAEAYQLTADSIQEKLGGLPELKLHCSVLGDKALKAAIDNYYDKKEEENPYKILVSHVICECHNVTDTQVADLIRKNEVKSLEDLKSLTNYGTTCGKCKEKMETLFNEYFHIYGIKDNNDN